MKLRLVAVCALSMLASISYAKDLKIGVVDFQKILQEAPLAQKLGDVIKKEFKPRNEKLMAEQNKLQEKAADLSKNQAVMTKAQVNKLQDELVRDKRDFERKAEDYQRDYQEKQGKLLEDFGQKVQVELDRIGKDKKFDFIIHKHALAYSSNSVDVTSDVMKSLK